VFLAALLEEVEDLLRAVLARFLPEHHARHAGERFGVEVVRGRGCGLFGVWLDLDGRQVGQGNDDVRPLKPLHRVAGLVRGRPRHAQDARGVEAFRVAVVGEDGSTECSGLLGGDLLGQADIALPGVRRGYQEARPYSGRGTIPIPV
jgi:hypothetical protein